MLIAGIDVGSNATRMTLAKPPTNGLFHQNHELIEKFRFPCRLGDDVFKTGYIGNEKEDRLSAAFLEISKLLEKHSVSKNFGVATSALREAKNGDMVLNKILADNPLINCKIISGELEAKLMSEGLFRRNVFDENSSHLHVDIGGGSLELSLFHHNKFVFQESLSIGTLKLIENTKSGALTKTHQDLLKSIQSFLKNKIDHTESKKLKLYGTGGNFKRLGKLKQALLKVNDQTHLTKDDLKIIYETLNKKSVSEISNTTPINEDNAALILPSLLIIDAILNVYPAQRIEVSKLSLSHALLDQLI